MSWAVRLGRGVLRCSAFVCSAPFRCLVGWERQNWQNTRGWRLVSSGGLRRGLRPGRLPELAGNLDRVDPSRLPPQQLVARAVELAVVQAAERNGEFVADLAPEGELLGDAYVVRLGGPAPANQAVSRSDVLEVIFIAKAPGFPEGEDALVDAVGAFLRLQPSGADCSIPPTQNRIQQRRRASTLASLVSGSFLQAPKFERRRPSR